MRIVNRYRIFVRHLSPALLFCLAIQYAGFPQSDPEQSPLVLDSKARSSIVMKISAVLQVDYISPETAVVISEYLETQLENKVYSHISSHEHFAKALSHDLQRISNDRHLQIYYAPQRIKVLSTEEETIEAQRQRRERDRFINYGFQRMERLAGNIGYLEIQEFAKERLGYDTAVAAMNFLSNSDALIIDLRKNRGGSPRMVRLIASYLFDEEPVHLFTHYYRDEHSTQEFWTLDYLPGKRMASQPVYILTSYDTFSAAEEFTYAMQVLNRATVVGETTGGGSNLGHWEYISKEFYMFVPNGRIEHPLTGTNWEGIGITPDIESPAEKALEIAQSAALQHLIATTTDSLFMGNLKWAQAGLKAKMNPVKIDPAAANGLIGKYGEFIVSLSQNTLHYKFPEGDTFKMIPMGNDLFMLEGTNAFRLQFSRTPFGEVNEMIKLFYDGRNEIKYRSQ